PTAPRNTPRRRPGTDRSAPRSTWIGLVSNSSTTSRRRRPYQLRRMRSSRPADAIEAVRSTPATNATRAAPGHTNPIDTRATQSPNVASVRGRGGRTDIAGGWAGKSGHASTTLCRAGSWGPSPGGGGGLPGGETGGRAGGAAGGGVVGGRAGWRPGGGG